MNDYTALRAAIAAGPTPGPWKHDDLDAFDEWPSEISAVVDGPDGLLTTLPTGVMQEEGDKYNERQWAKARDTQSYRDAAYIAAADPTTLDALLAERDGLRDDVARLRLLLDALAKERGTDWAHGYRAALEGVKR